MPLYMQPPDDPIVKKSGCFSAPLYLVTGNCYGLANAPRVWYKRVVGVLEQNNFIMRDYDRCFFYHYHPKSGRLDCVMIVHVDDFMASYSEEFDVISLEKMFLWGSVTKLTTENEGIYRGKEVRLVADGDEVKVEVSQKAFCQNLDPPNIPPGKMEDKLTEEAWKEFRSLSGCLQWLAGQSRPELGATVSLANRGQEKTLADLKKLGEAVKHVITHPGEGITIPGITLDRSTVVLVYADSSWANAMAHSSQYGLLVVLRPTTISESTTPAALVDWKSGRSVPSFCAARLTEHCIQLLPTHAIRCER